ncbi:MAG: YidC/Oxa1 family membrane protein insertase [Patescibacteria group bacterium]|nr:YidC/Oxa1 family membrane protein insertase [Patescibacteria group bacterium]
MFTTFIVQPLFNLLVLIYAILPGHNFGLSLIIFTIIIRLLLWPLVKKQLHQAKAMRKMQPQIKEIKKQTKGNRQKESQMLMELYKERGINPLGAFPTLIVQFIVLIGLYSGLQKIIRNPHSIVDFSYPAIQHIGWIQNLSHDIHKFDNTLLGIIDLGRPAVGPKGFYLGAFLLVAGSAIAQYFQAKQLMPDNKDQRSLRAILKGAGEGKQADQSEVNAAVGQTTRYLIPGMIFIFTINLAAALSLYWLVGGLVAYIQQSIVLGKDEKEMEAIGDKPSKKDIRAIPEAEVVSSPSGSAAVSGAPAATTRQKAGKKKSAKGKAKRRKR